MNSVACILQQVRTLGVDIRPVGDKLQLRPPGRLSAELLEVVREHKQAIIAFLRDSEVGHRVDLTRALEQKQQEIAVMRGRLASPCCTGDSEYHRWGEDQIETLTQHISEIQRHMRDGGNLNLPPCCRDDGHICLIAMRRFDGCLMLPSECRFSTWRPR